MKGKLAQHGKCSTVCHPQLRDRHKAHFYRSTVATLLVAVQTLCPVAPANGQNASVTYEIEPDQDTASIQAVFDRALPGDVVSFAAGRYKITKPLYPPCGAIVTGPVGSPSTAVLAASFTFDNIFIVPGCLNPTTIEYLGFANTGGIYVTAPSTGLTITQNQFANLPADHSQTSDMGIYFDGKGGGTISAATIISNTFGDPSSCAAVMSVNQDMGGLCTGIFFQGNLDGVLVESNLFTHLEEGFHVLCYGNLCRGSASPKVNNFVSQWNDFTNIHRIAMEIQPENSSNVTIQYNSYESPYRPSTFTMGISAACCGGLDGATVPFINNNVLLADTPPAGDYIAYGLEWWGVGAQADDNLVQGNWANGIVWGKGGGMWEIKNNVVEGPFMGGNYGCYICDEREGAASAPAQSGNSTSLTVATVVSVEPRILVRAGDNQASAIVTLSDSGTNHSIYYTTDGSTPTTSSTRYVAPFSVSLGTQLKAIGMWGQGANPLSFPIGYGYAPSAVTTLQIEKVPPVLLSASLAAKGNVGSIQQGHTLQFVAHAIYSDGSTGMLPDNQGNAVTAWNTSNHSIAKISSSGHVTGIGPGTVTVMGMIGRLVASPTSVTVTDEEAVVNP